MDHDPFGAFRTTAPPALSARATGPLAGLRLAVKDNLDVAGLPTGGGCRTPLAARADRTAAAVARLVDAGMVVVGKTNMSELAFGGWGTNAATGCPRNPWDAAAHRVPGGSSSGSAVAVAAGLADAALGTDTGGSVRIPAALCGLTGLRPRRETVGREGLHLLAPSLDAIGPMAWTVATAARMLAAMAGGFDAEAALNAPVDGLRVAVLDAAALARADREVRAAYAAAVETIRGLVADVSPAAMPRPFDAYVGKLGTILGHEAWRRHGARLRRHEAEMDPWVAKRLKHGSTVDDSSYDAALAEREAERRRFADALTGFDLLLTPATPIAAPLLSEVDEATLPLSHYVRAFSYLDLPAVALPCGITDDGLPIGLQIVGLTDEAPPVSLAAAYQRATRWHERRPPL
jgi:aspartyl-tRNA(Asn)/glutamyl-tRNA(Gln) amidotransferase subunit A